MVKADRSRGSAQFEHDGACGLRQVAEQGRDRRTARRCRWNPRPGSGTRRRRRARRAGRIWRKGGVAESRAHCLTKPHALFGRVPPGKTFVMSDWIDSEGYRANVGIVLMRDNGEVFLGPANRRPRLAVSAGWRAAGRTSRAGAVSRVAGRDRPRAPAGRRWSGSTADWIRYRLPKRYVRRGRGPDLHRAEAALVPAATRGARRVAWSSASRTPTSRSSTAGAGQTTGSRCAR